MTGRVSYGPERARSRIKHERVAERARASDPQPVGEHDIGRAALERYFSGFCRCELDGLDCEPKLALNSVSLDDINFPRERAGFLYRNANAISLRIGGRKHDDRNRGEPPRGPHRE